MHAWNVLHAAHLIKGRKNYAKKSPSGHHRRICRAISSQLRHVSTIGKIFIIQQYLLHMFSQYGERRPTNGWDRLVSLASQQISKGFCVLASLLHRRRSTEINQTLHDVWPSPELVHYIYCIYSFASLAPERNSARCKIYFASQVLRYPILAALLHGTRSVDISQTLCVVSSRDRAAIPFHNGRSNCLVTDLLFTYFQT